MPNVFSRIAGSSPRVSAASRKLFAIVSATVSTAGLAIARSLRLPPAPHRMPAPLWMPALSAGLVSNTEPVFNDKSFLTPRFLLLPAPFAPGAGFLGAEVEFLNVLGTHQPFATVVHDDPADFQHIAIMRRFQRDLGVLLDQQDRHALLFVDAADDGENLLHQDWRQAKRRLVGAHGGTTVAQ